MGWSFSWRPSTSPVPRTRSPIHPRPGLIGEIGAHANAYPHHEYHAVLASKGAYVSMEGLGSCQPVDAKREM